jgi:hypothetical protein
MEVAVVEQDAPATPPLGKELQKWQRTNHIFACIEFTP